MSATLDTMPLAKLLGEAPVVAAAGREYPVAVDYLERPSGGRIAPATAAGIVRVAMAVSGDILAFLPGISEIRETAHLLAGRQELAGIRILPLFADLPPAEQDRVMTRGSEDRRRIILATAVAETSLTIEGIEAVVDSGWSRRPRFSPESGLSTLTTVRVSQAAADQRAGRAGRLGPGYCLRLWTRAEDHNLPASHPPEILTVDLAGLVLELALWGVDDPGQLRWLDPPREGAIAAARQLLTSLGPWIGRSALPNSAGKWPIYRCIPVWASCFAPESNKDWGHSHAMPRPCSASAIRSLATIRQRWGCG
jgi:ATP-dependent helicase HrpB